MSRGRGIDGLSGTDKDKLLAGVRAIFPRTRLVLAGTGPRGAALRAEVPDAVFLSWVPRQSMPEIYSAADLLLLPLRLCPLEKGWQRWWWRQWRSWR